MDTKRLRVLGVLLFVIALALGAFIAPTAALAQEGDVCPAGDSGKINTTGDPATVTVTAPEGQLIWQYCVKAGSEQSGGGVVFVQVDPPASTVVIDHPDVDSVSHYSVYYVDIVEEEPTPTPTPTPTPDVTPTPDDTPEDEVLGERIDRGSSGGDASEGSGPAVAGERISGQALPFTGIDPAPFIALSGLLAASGATALVIARRK